MEYVIVEEVKFFINFIGVFLIMERVFYGKYRKDKRKGYNRDLKWNISLFSLFKYKVLSYINL